MDQPARDKLKKWWDVRDGHSSPSNSSLFGYSSDTGTGGESLHRSGPEKPRERWPPALIALVCVFGLLGVYALLKLLVLMARFMHI